MVKVTPTPLVEEPLPETPPHALQSRCTETSVPLCRTDSTFDADHLRVLLIQWRLRMVLVRQRWFAHNVRAVGWLVDSIVVFGLISLGLLVSIVVYLVLF